MSSEGEQRLAEAKSLLAQPMRDIAFQTVIQTLYNVCVEKFDREENRAVLSTLTEAVRAVCQTVRATPIKRSRANEAGNDMKQFVIRELQARQLRADAARTRSGQGKSAGYPDIRIQREGLPIFLEVKTYAAASYGTAQRSFYLSPAENPKVFEDGYHIAAGFEMERNGHLFHPVAFDLVDLHGLKCDMKYEFNSDNRRLYEPSRILAKERV